jgi:DNA-binding response OmpR family regulator
MHILVVEDERRLARLLQEALEEESHVVELAFDGEQALELALDRTYDLIVLDVMLPGRDGLSVTRELRAAKVPTPVLMLTARDAVEDRAFGLDSGADDYLVKPFAFLELHARVRALGRRVPEVQAPTTMNIQDLTLDLTRHEARRDGRRIELTAKEFSLLEFLMRHPEQVLTRTQILDHVWGYDYVSDTNTVDIYVYYLRKKIDRKSDHPLIHTVRGVGYRLGD